MRSEGEEARGGGEFEWDIATEEELVAIEAAYSAKRQSSAAEASEGSTSQALHRQMAKRRLPEWANVAASARIRTVDPGGHGVPYVRNAPWNLHPHRCLANVKVKFPTMRFSGNIVYSRTSEEVKQSTLEILDKIRNIKQSMSSTSIGLDIEWKPIFRRGAAQDKAAVMQLCMDSGSCYVMHIIHSGIPTILRSFLEDASTVKVGVCIANDAAKIFRDYQVRVQSVEDISDVANIKLGCQPKKKWGLCSLAERITCKELLKPSYVRMGNWEADFLSREQLQYAATDAFASWFLYEALKSLPSPEGRNEHPEVACGTDKGSNRRVPGPGWENPSRPGRQAAAEGGGGRRRRRRRAAAPGKLRGSGNNTKKWIPFLEEEPGSPSSTMARALAFESLPCFFSVVAAAAAGTGGGAAATDSGGTITSSPMELGSQFSSSLWLLLCT